MNIMIDYNNFIHPTAIIGPDVQLSGTNNHIGPYCIIQGNTIIGSNNRFESFCSIGAPAEHRDYFNNTKGRTYIGNNNIFREYVTVNAGTINTTTLYNNIVMLRNSHVGHDSIIGDNVNLSCNVLIGGHSVVQIGSNFGLGSMCHQFSKIGAYSMIGMGTVVTKKSKIRPGGIYIGSPAKYHNQNDVGLQRHNINPDQLYEITIKYENL